MRRALTSVAHMLPAVMFAAALVLSCWAGSGLLATLADKLWAYTNSLSAPAILSCRLVTHALLAGVLALLWRRVLANHFEQSKLGVYALPSLAASAAASLTQAVFVAFAGSATDLLGALPWIPSERAYVVSLGIYVVLLSLLLSVVWSCWGDQQVGTRGRVLALVFPTALLLLMAVSSPQSFAAAMESVGLRAVVGGHLSFDPVGPLAVSRAWVVVAPLAGAFAFPDAPLGVPRQPRRPR